MSELQDVDALKRRGRRRLIGAIALMLIAVILLPMVFDAEPRPAAPPVNVRIPDEEGSQFKPRVLPRPGAESARESATSSSAVPATTPTPPETDGNAAAATQAVTNTPAKVSSAAPAVVPPGPATALPTPPPAPSGTSARTPSPEPAAQSDAGTPKPASAGFVIPVAAFAETDRLKSVTSSLAAAKIPYFTESVPTTKGTVTRVRAGPFASRDLAEKALARLKALGLKPGNVIARGT